MRTQALFTMLLLSFASEAFSQPDYERFLLPVVLFDDCGSCAFRGAHGSLWTTELVLRNQSADMIRFRPNFCGKLSVVCPRSSELRAYETLNRPPIWYDSRGSWAPHGVFLFLERPASRVSMSLHLREIGTAAGWGSALPVVSEAEAFDALVEILNVPTDPAFRHTLRIYDYDNRNGSSYRVRFYHLAAPFSEMDSSDVLYESIVTASGVEYWEDFPWGDVPLRPGYAQLDLPVQTLPLLASAERLRITVEPMQEGRFWAYLSLTDNATQQVTLFVPEK